MSKSKTPTSFFVPVRVGQSPDTLFKYMEEKGQSRIHQQESLCLTINYDTSIRCIDLENTLSGFRMILQHDLAKRTKLSTRSFTDVAKIESIEQGSIIINFLFDLVNINANLLDVNINLISIDIDLINIVLRYLMPSMKKDDNGKLQVAIANIKTALKHFKSITLRGNGKSVELRTDENGEIEQTNTNN